MGRSSQFLPPAARAAPEQASPSFLEDLTGGLGNSGMLELLAGSAANTMQGGACYGPTGDPVQDIINKKVEGNAGYDSVWDMAWGDALTERKRTDPDNKNEDLAAAEHYLWGRASAEQTAKSHGGGTWGHLLGMGDAAVTGGLAVGYEGYKAGAYAMKDHNMAIGAAMAATGVGIIPGLAMMAFGDKVGDGALRAVSADDKLPSRPSLKSLGWGLAGSWDAMTDQASQLW